MMGMMGMRGMTNPDPNNLVSSYGLLTPSCVAGFFV